MRTIVLTQEELDKLPEYSRSLPTHQLHEGKLIGVLRWKRRFYEGWLVFEATQEDETTLAIEPLQPVIRG